MRRIGPQPGPQTTFAASSAQIAIYGGAAGGGKTFALLIDPLRNHKNSKFKATIFRRTTPQIANDGGLWDESKTLYPLFGAIPKQFNYRWTFPSAATIRFAHLEREEDKFKYQGAQMAFLGFDELTHFTETQFFYMLSRMRSMSGVPGRVRATCNPDADSWVARFLEWWIDQETGFPIPERAGKVRWFARDGDHIVWGDSASEVKEKIASAGPVTIPMSVSFIPATIQDNRILLDKDPAYLAALSALPKVDRERLRDGNWKVRASAGMLFRRNWFPIVDHVPTGHRTVSVRFWDRAATEPNAANPDPDYTVGLKLTRDHLGHYYVEDVERDRLTPGKVMDRVEIISKNDGQRCVIGLEQEPGSSGKAEVDAYIRRIKNRTVKPIPARTDKVTRAKPVSAQAEHGNVSLVRGKWNNDFLIELENFPDSGKKDQVDALSGAFAILEGDEVAGEWSEESTKEQKTMAGSLRSKDSW